MVSMDDVAARAQVSKMTVSRVLNGNPAVSDAVRVKVLAVCQELHYRLNHNIQDLVLKSRRGTTRNIALVLVGKEFADPAYSRLIDFVAEEVNRAHYQLMLVKLTREEKTIYALPPVLRDERIDGILLTGNLDIAVMALIRDMGVPCVTIGNYDDAILGSCSNVRLNIHQVMAAAVKILCRQGCRRIAFVDENPDNFAVREWYDAFVRSLEQQGLDPKVAPTFWGTGPFSGIYHLLEPVFRQPQLPFDGIYCCDYRQAEEIVCLARGRCGFDCKIDFKLCCGRSFEYYKLQIPADYIDFNKNGMVAAAFHQLIGLLEGKMEKQTIVVNYDHEE